MDIEVIEEKNFVKIRYLPEVRVRRIKFIFVIVLVLFFLIFLLRRWMLEGIFSFLLFLVAMGGIIGIYINLCKREIVCRKDEITLKEFPFDVCQRFAKTSDTVLMMENIPWVHWGIPLEKWRIVINSPKGAYIFIEDENEPFTVKKVAKILSKKCKIPLVDYTYQDQLNTVMFLLPEDVDLNFGKMAVIFPDILCSGEMPRNKGISEDIMASGKRVYMWSALTYHTFMSVLMLAGGFIILIMADVIGAKKESLITIPFLDEVSLYYIVLLVSLGVLAFLSGIKKKLILDLDKITYVEKLFNKIICKKEIDVDKIEEVRVKPSPEGFVLLIYGDKDYIKLKTHFGRILDFGHLLWLNGRIQDFLLDIRMAEHLK